MITSIFSKSKPINFIIVFFITALAFWIAHYNSHPNPLGVDALLKLIFSFGLGYVSLLILNFIVSKNRLTKNNNYEILLYSLFLLAMSSTTTDKNILFANFFILLGLRRVLSIRTQIRLNKKLFDAAFWITIAALFYFWSILFFLVILISLAFYTDNKLNHWLIPFSGLLTVFILAVCFSVINYDDYFRVFSSLPTTGYDFSRYNSSPFIAAITLFLSFGIWSSIFYGISIKQKKKAFRPSYKTILVAFIIALALVIIVPKTNGSEFLFMFAPLSIIVTNYIQTIKDKWFKEIFLLILLVAPFIILML